MQTYLWYCIDIFDNQYFIFIWGL